MKNHTKRILATMIALTLVLAFVGACTQDPDPTPAPVVTPADNQTPSDNNGEDPPADPPAIPAEPVTINIADANSTHHLSLYVAYEQGLFAERNLNVVIEQSTGSAAAEALVGGSVDIIYACPTSVYTPIATGAPIAIISQVKIPCTSVLVVPVDAPYEKPEDLEGAKIAGFSEVCCAVVIIREALLNQYGVDIDLYFLSAAESIQGLESGDLDGAILEEPFVALALLITDDDGNPKYKTIFDGTAEPNLAGENPPCRTIVANTDFLEANTDAAILFIEAIEEASKIIVADPTADEIVDIAALYVSVDRQAIINSNPKLGFTTQLDKEGLIRYADALVALGRFDENPGEALFAPQFKGITWN